MRRLGIILLVGAVLFPGMLKAQSSGLSATLGFELPMSIGSGDGSPGLTAADVSIPEFVPPTALPRMSPELALDDTQAPIVGYAVAKLGRIVELMTSEDDLCGVIVETAENARN